MSDAPARENRIVPRPEDSAATEQGALPDGQADSGQSNVKVVVPERPSAKVDSRKIPIYLMMITVGSERYLVVSTLT